MSGDQVVQLRAKARRSGMKGRMRPKGRKSWHRMLGIALS